MKIQSESWQIYITSVLLLFRAVTLRNVIRGAFSLKYLRITGWKNREIPQMAFKVPVSVHTSQQCIKNTVVLSSL